MHPVIRDFVTDVAEVIALPDPIVEFGSLQVEAGQDIDLRPLFPGRPFTGTDVRDGPGVDRVEDLLSLSFGDGEVGTAICLETLEHVPDPPAACRELARVVADGGVAILSAPTLLGIHAYPDDYFRFMPSSFTAMLAGFDDVWSCGLGDPELPMWVVGVAAKGRQLGLALEKLPRTERRQREFMESKGSFRVGPARMTPRELAKQVLPQIPRVARQRVLARFKRY